MSLSSEELLARALDTNALFKSWMDLEKVCLFLSVGREGHRGAVEMGLDLPKCWEQCGLKAQQTWKNRFKLVL